MDLQALRYASMVGRMKFDRAVAIYTQYLQRRGQPGGDPRALILNFLEWDDVDPSQFAQDVRIVLVAANFSREITSTVLWLNERRLDIRCIRLTPYSVDDRLFVDVQQVIPLPEMGDYLTRLREKTQEEQEARAGAIDFTRFDVSIGDERYPGLNKRRAILRIFRSLCEVGITPEAIAALVPRSQQRVILALDGTLTAEDFRTRAASDVANFDPRRWFGDDEELVHTNGKTYAFSNQWGGEKWRETMDRLRSTYPQFRIEFSEAS